MPELPEVETIARELCSGLCGRRIIAVSLPRPASLETGAPSLSRKAFREQVPGLAVAKVWRRAKILLMDLVEEVESSPSSTAAAAVSKKGLPSSPAAATGSSAAGRISAAEAPTLHLAVRLGMSGRLWLAAPGTEPEKHTHVIFDLDDGRRLFFTDPRTFGSVRAVSGGKLAAWPAYAALGPEPLEAGPEEFAARFAGRSGKMKALLLDQNVVAGVGNIYADESLFRAGISPEARADKVSEERLHRLHAALQEVLREAIAANGSSIRDYRDAHGDAGAFQNAFRAYGRHGQPCLNCGAKLTKTTVAGRTTTYCRKCQKG
jgi:formamidopyrimidine-DNA glycosylase